MLKPWEVAPLLLLTRDPSIWTDEAASFISTLGQGPAGLSESGGHNQGLPICSVERITQGVPHAFLVSPLGLLFLLDY